MNYKISMSLVYGKDKFGNPFQAARECGDFRVTKQFTVTNLKDRSSKPNGFIVQYVQKMTQVTHKCGAKWSETTKERSECDAGAEEAILTSSEDIERFTAGNTKYMTHSYLELFEVKDGKSVSNDSFQNGAIVKYSWDDEEDADAVEKKQSWQPIIEDEDEAFFTKGTILMGGTNIFIKDPAIQTILPWDKREKTPANGLPYLIPTRDNLTVIFSMRVSEPLVHFVAATWDYPTSPKSNKTIIKTLSPVNGRSFLPPALSAIGARLNTRGVPTVLSPLFKNATRRSTRRSVSLASLAASIRAKAGTLARGKTVKRTKRLVTIKE